MLFRVLYAVILACVMLLVDVAFAQQPPPGRSFTVMLPEPAWNKIGGVLGKQPYEDIGDILNAMRQQIGAQMQQVDAAAAQKAQADAQELERLRKEVEALKAEIKRLKGGSDEKPE